MSKPAVTLRYWACRGRVEFLRCMLHDAEVAFTDERLTRDDMKNWTDQKRFVDVAGPFGMLPLLHWTDADEDAELTVSQTLSIAQFLHLKLWPKEQQGLAELTRVMSLGCHVYEDLYMPLIKLLWAAGGQSPQAYLNKTLPERLIRLDAHLPEDGWLLGGDRPCWAEYLLFDALQAIGEVFGRDTVTSSSGLRSFLIRMSQRPALREYLQSEERSSAPITMAPGEADIRAQISESLLG